MCQPGRMQCCARPKRGARGGGAAKAEPPPPLLFETVDSELILSEDRTTVTRDAPKSPTTLKKGRKLGGGGKPGGGVGRYKLAACDNPTDLMTTGVHCVEFTLAQASGNVTLGVMQEDYDPKQPIAPGEARGDGAESWGLSTRSGSLSFRGKATMWKGRRACPISHPTAVRPPCAPRSSH